MHCSKLINPFIIAIMLGSACVAFADDEVTADEQSPDDGTKANPSDVPAASHADELAKKLSNPIASLISVPLHR